MNNIQKKEYLAKVGERIKQVRLKREMSQEELAIKCGYNSRSTINKIEMGVNDVPQSKMKLIADALNVDVVQLLGDFDSATSLLSRYPNIHPVDTQVVPMLGSVSCGLPKYANIDRDSYVRAGTKIKCDFCLTASGDSMIGVGIHDGDIVFCREQPMVDNGDIAVVGIGDEATLKRFYYYKEQCLLILRPENPDYPELVYTGAELEEVHVLGKAVAYQADVK